MKISFAIAALLGYTAAQQEFVTTSSDPNQQRRDEERRGRGGRDNRGGQATATTTGGHGGDHMRGAKSPQVEAKKLWDEFAAKESMTMPDKYMSRDMFMDLARKLDPKFDNDTKNREEANRTWDKYQNADGNITEFKKFQELFMEKMKEEMEKAMNKEMNNRGGHGGPEGMHDGPEFPDAKDAFDRFAGKRPGQMRYMDRNDFGLLVKSQDDEAEDKNIDKDFKDADQDGNGMLYETEFRPFYKNVMEALHNKRQQERQNGPTGATMHGPPPPMPPRPLEAENMFSLHSRMSPSSLMNELSRDQFTKMIMENGGDFRIDPNNIKNYFDDADMNKDDTLDQNENKEFFNKRNQELINDFEEKMRNYHNNMNGGGGPAIMPAPGMHGGPGMHADPNMIMDMLRPFMENGNPIDMWTNVLRKMVDHEVEKRVRDQCGGGMNNMHHGPGRDNGPQRQSEQDRDGCEAKPMPSNGELWGMFADSDNGVSKEGWYKGFTKFENCAGKKDVEKGWMKAEEGGNINRGRFDNMMNKMRGRSARRNDMNMRGGDRGQHGGDHGQRGDHGMPAGMPGMPEGMDAMMGMMGGMPGMEGMMGDMGKAMGMMRDGMAGAMAGPGMGVEVHHAAGGDHAGQWSADTTNMGAPQSAATQWGGDKAMDGSKGNW